MPNFIPFLFCQLCLYWKNVYFEFLESDIYINPLIRLILLYVMRDYWIIISTNTYLNRSKCAENIFKFHSKLFFQGGGVLNDNANFRGTWSENEHIDGWKTSHAGDTPIYTSTGTDTLLLYDTSTPLDLRKLGEDTNRRKRD